MSYSGPARILDTSGAHPLGNFTTNVHLGVEMAASEINLHLIVDMAEIPTFRELPSIDLSVDDAISDEEKAAYAASACEQHRAGVDVTLEQSIQSLIGNGGDLLFRPGQGGRQVSVSNAAIAPSLQPPRRQADEPRWRPRTMTHQVQPRRQ